MSNSADSTPKRKRMQAIHGDELALDTVDFSFDLHAAPEDGGASPRTNVAHRFRGLAIESGGGVDAGRTSPTPQPRWTMGDRLDEADEIARKRVRMPDTEMSDADDAGITSGPPATLAGASSDRQIGGGAANQLNDSDIFTTPMANFQASDGPTLSLRFAVDPVMINPDETPPGDHVAQKESPGHQDEVSDMSRVRKRAGTPPLTMTSNPAASEGNIEETVVIDPVRASLTWHDDEITGYDPDDSDDDGTGINGIGFKPTPATAYARTIKRKQQLAEYRKREEREARARRSQRRRGSPVPGLVELKEKVERRRVRFMESNVEVITTV